MAENVVERRLSRDATPPPHRERIAGLDALRGIAAMAVVLLHFTTDFADHYRPTRRASLGFPYGAYGVHLFFLISGFVIFMTVRRIRRPMDFVVSRFSRLYPPYWAAVILTTATLACFPMPETPGVRKLVPRAIVNLSMVQSWFRVGSVDLVYWTLQVEMSFYLLMLVLIWRRATDRILGVMATLLVLAIFDHLALARPLHPLWGQLREVLFLEHAYLFAAGIVIYQARAGWRPIHGAIVLLCVACPATAWYFPNHPPVDTAVSIGLGTLVYLTATGRLDFLANRVFLYLGAISYSLYLTHHWVGTVLLVRLDRLGVHPDVALLATIGLCLGIASIMRHWVERPSLAWVRAHLNGPTLPWPIGRRPRPAAMPTALPAAS